MKLKYLILSVFSAFLMSCGDTAGGNKSIFPVDKEEVTSHSETESHPEASTSHASEYKHSLTFTAFKTPKKVGVDGIFKEITLTDTQKREKLEDALKGSHFSVNTSSIDTNNNPERDEKIRNFFFGKLTSGGTIDGSFGEFKDGKVMTKIKLNEVEKEISMNYTVTEKEISINGSIDIINDFSGTEALASITEACFDLHEGKTWSEVKLAVKISK